MNEQPQLPRARRPHRYTWAPTWLRHTLHALRYLHPDAQLELLEFWRTTDRYIEGEPIPYAHRRRRDIYALERVINQKDATALTDYGPLFPRLAKWGLYPVLTTNITQVATETSQLEAKIKQIKARQQRELEKREAARQAAQDALHARLTELLGPTFHKATWISFPDGHIKPDLDTIVYLPEAPDYEPDPDRPGVLVKSPALAIHLTSKEWRPQLDAYMSGTEGQGYHGINVLHRLKTAHPELFPQEATA